MKKDEELRELRSLARELLHEWKPRSHADRVLLVRLLTALSLDEMTTFQIGESA